MTWGSSWGWGLRFSSVKVNERGAMGSKSTPAYQTPCFSLLRMVLKLGLSF